MSISIRIIQTFSIALLALPFSLQAESWSCRHDNNVREIQIEHPADAAVPCKVMYRKLTEGVEDKALWTAENDAAYCEEKARAFVEKQVGWGWTCVETVADKTSEAESTEAAAPAEADTSAEAPAKSEATE